MGVRFESLRCSLQKLGLRAHPYFFKMPVGARRTQSLPSKYMIPSESMGEYEGPNRRRSAPAKPAHLFPLNEEGTYGRPPAGPKPPSPIFKRERKPKIYSSYAVDNKCCLHAKKIEKIDEQRKKEQEEARARRHRSMSGRRNVSASPSRASSRAGSEARENIPSESMGEYENNGRNRRRSATNSRSSKSPEPLARTEASLRKKSGDFGRKMTPNTTTGYSSNSRYSNSSASSYKFSAVREETESDYLYQENRKSSGYSKYANDGGLSNGFGSMSLNGLREPQIDSWDSMGILGLSSKMWKESTAKQQENFMSTTSAFAGREEFSANSYIM